MYAKYWAPDRILVINADTVLCIWSLYFSATWSQDSTACYFQVQTSEEKRQVLL